MILHRILRPLVETRAEETSIVLLMFSYSFLAMTAYNMVQPITRSKFITAHGAEITEAVSKITWTAAGADTSIKAGQFQEFEVSAGPLPEVDQIIFKTLQTYSDGNIVRWIDEPTNGQQLEHPAPVLKLAKAPADAANTTTNVAANTTDDTSDPRTGWALGLSIAGLVTALAALAVTTLRRRPPAAI